MTISYEIVPFLQASGPIIDVRSPKEFLQGHIPGAHNIPIFNNEERAAVGYSYKQEGHDIAFNKGLDIVTEKLDLFAIHARKICTEGQARIYCWRGGLRSSSIAELFQLFGIDCHILKGGYKTFRKWTLETLSQSRQLKIVGGLTGSGKTHILHALKGAGEQVIDFEGIAKHRGSSYGYQEKQPSTEHFENEIAIQWTALDSQRPVWLEDESRLVGHCAIPNTIFSAMQEAPLYFIELPFAERVELLQRDYSYFKEEDAIECTMKLEKKLGGLRTKQAIEFIKEGNTLPAAKIILEYYDKSYHHHIKRRNGNVINIEFTELSLQVIVQELISKEAALSH